MAFDPLSLLFLKFRGRVVAVFRDRCSDYDVSPFLFPGPSIFSLGLHRRYHRQQQSIIAVARSSFRPLKLLSPDAGDLILLASIPGYPDASDVELTKDVWPTVSSIVHSVTIALEPGASVTNGSSSWLTPFFPYTRNAIGVLRVGVQLYGRLS